MGILGLDEIVQPRVVFGRLHPPVDVVDGKLFKVQEGDRVDVLCGEKVDTCLSLGDGVNDHVTE